MKHLWWHSNGTAAAGSSAISILDRLKRLDTPCFIVQNGAVPFLTDDGDISSFPAEGSLPCLGILPGITPHRLGDPSFQQDYGTSCSYMAGAMAQGISSVRMVVALGKGGFLGSFGSGGLGVKEIEMAIVKIKNDLPEGPFAFNLLSAPYYPDYEKAIVDLYLHHGIQAVEASAYITPSPYLVYYRVAGMRKGTDGAFFAGNRIIAKISRREVAEKFMEPPPSAIIRQLVDARLVSAEQADASSRLPLADDITVEADSAGHTDNRPLISLLPSILAIRDQFQQRHGYGKKIRIGAAGGISTPQAALAAFTMGADYIVTGSVNQACVEAGTSEQTRLLLAQATMADVAMAPAADMFEMGARVQVLKKGTMFPFVSQKLYDLYRQWGSIEELPPEEREKLERKVFRQDMNAVWRDTVAYFRQRDPKVIEKAENNGKKKMALLFKWYLGQSSHWAISGTADRSMDAQIWCGQAMGAFNDWVKGTPLEDAGNRRVADIAAMIMHGAALLYRVRFLKTFSFPMDPSTEAIRPEIIPDIPVDTTFTLKPRRISI